MPALRLKLFELALRAGRLRATDNVNNAGDWVQAVVKAVVVTKYYTVAGQGVAVRENDVLYYVHTDHLGSTSLTTNETGAVVAEQKYLSYGEVRWMTGTLPTDLTYTGQRQDEIGLLDYHARWYSSQLGRFTSADSMTPGVGSAALNRYAYAGANPLRYIDSTGHYTENVHYTLTYVIAYDVIMSIMRQVSPQLPEVELQHVAVYWATQVAESDKQVDYNLSTSPGTFVPLPGTEGEIAGDYWHFASRTDAEARLAEAIRNRDVDAFGKSLHTYQDYYAHTGSGYSWLGGEAGVKELREKCPECYEGASPAREHELDKQARSWGHLRSGQGATDYYDPNSSRDQTMARGTRAVVTLFFYRYLTGQTGSNRSTRFRPSAR